MPAADRVRSRDMLDTAPSSIRWELGWLVNRSLVSLGGRNRRSRVSSGL
jgi:hypothetical protein